MQPYHSGARRGLSISVALRWPTCARHVPHCQIKTLQALLLRPSLALPMWLMIETLLGSGEKEKTWVQSFSFPLKLLGTKWDRVIPNCSMGNCWAKWSLNNHKLIQSCINIKVIQLKKKCCSGHALPKQKNKNKNKNPLLFHISLLSIRQVEELARPFAAVSLEVYKCSKRGWLRSASVITLMDMHFN